MNYRITGLSPEPFRHLFGLKHDELARHGAKRYVVDESPGFPDRIEMRDCALGETVLLVNYFHQPANTPYRACHAIFVREGASQSYVGINEVPGVMRHRLLSLRAFDGEDMMIEADVVQGSKIKLAISRLFADPRVAYLHAHNAKQGCYSGRIDRL